MAALPAPAMPILEAAGSWGKGLFVLLPRPEVPEVLPPDWDIPGIPDFTDAVVAASSSKVPGMREE